MGLFSRAPSGPVKAGSLPALTSTAAQADALSFQATSGGTSLGVITGTRDRLMIDLVRPAPTRAVLLCNDPLIVRLLILRLVGDGVTAVVATDRPAPWQEWVTGIGGQVPIATVRTDHTQPLPAPLIAAPLFVVEDARDVPADVYAPRLAWQTTLRVRSGLNERSRGLLEGADLIFVGKLPGDAAEAVAAALNLPAGGAESIAGLNPSGVLLVADRRYSMVATVPTPSEQRLL
jgi:hypothetical protein